MMSLVRSRTAATAPRITLCTTLRWWHSSEATRESHQHFTLASPHAADPRGPHLEQGLVADAFARREFSSLLHVRTGQSQCDLNTCSPVQLPDQTRSLRHFLLRLRRFLLQKLASLATGPLGGLFVLVCKRRWLDRLLHGLLSSKTPRKVVPLLPGIQFIRSHDADSVIALCQDDRQQPSHVGLGSRRFQTSGGERCRAGERQSADGHNPLGSQQGGLGGSGRL